ncbi:MAG: hypothetical protein K0S01_3250 [Herbinix sp.]|jgi:hypothetical protein|nr:hypothetical protein [Herbinix sp.]
MGIEYRIIEMDTWPRVAGAYAYDVEGALKNEGGFLQSQYTRGQKMKVKVGDFAFILLNNQKNNQENQIKYLCKIVKCNIVRKIRVIDKYEINAIKDNGVTEMYMELKLESECPDGSLSKNDLTALGLNEKQNHGNKVRGELLDYLMKYFN